MSFVLVYDISRDVFYNRDCDGKKRIPDKKPSIHEKIIAVKQYITFMNTIGVSNPIMIKMKTDLMNKEKALRIKAQTIC